MFIVLYVYVFRSIRKTRAGSLCSINLRTISKIIGVSLFCSINQITIFLQNIHQIILQKKQNQK